MALDLIERMFLIFQFMEVDLHFCYKNAQQTGASLSLEKSLNNKQNWKNRKKSIYKNKNIPIIRVYKFEQKGKIGNKPSLRH